MSPPILQCGKCERLKAAAHGVALGTALMCGAYNLAAWLVRRQRHLIVNAVFYSAATVWEAGHIRHHLTTIVAAKAQPCASPVELSDAA